MTTRPMVNNLSVKNTKTAADTSDLEIKIEMLLKLAVIPDIKILSPKVSVKDGTVTLGGTVNAYWKRACLGEIMKNEFPYLNVENALTVITLQEGDFLPEKKPCQGTGKGSPGECHVTQETLSLRI